MHDHMVRGWTWVTWACLALAAAFGLLVAFAADSAVLACRLAWRAATGLWRAVRRLRAAKAAPPAAALSTGCWLCDAIGQPCERAGEAGHPELPGPWQRPLPLPTAKAELS